MDKEPTPSLAELYAADETAWLETMSRLIEQGNLSQLDYTNLGGYLADLVQRNRGEVESRMTLLIAHLLNWQHQPQSRNSGWRGLIETQRRELEEFLEQRALRSHAESVLGEMYAHAVKLAAAEFGLSEDTYPAQCPYTVDQILVESAV